MSKKKQPRNNMSALFLFSVMMLTVLLLVGAGTQVYRTLVKRQIDHNDARATLSYISARVRAADVQNSVSLEKGPLGIMLVLKEGEEYETRFYWYDGALLEEYTRCDAVCAPENAYTVMDTSWFDIRPLSPYLMEVETQQGMTRVTVLSGIGGGINA